MIHTWAGDDENILGCFSVTCSLVSGRNGCRDGQACQTHNSEAQKLLNILGKIVRFSRYS